MAAPRGHPPLSSVPGVPDGRTDHRHRAVKPAAAGGGPPYCVRIPQGLSLALQAQCMQDGGSGAQFLRDCLRAYLDDRVPAEVVAAAAPAADAPPATSRPVCTRLSFPEHAALLEKTSGDSGLPARLVRACVTAYLAGRLRIPPPTARPAYFS